MLTLLSLRRNRVIAGLGLTTALVAAGSASVFATPEVTSVAIRGAQFISEESIRATCDLQDGRDYTASDLRAAEACLVETGAFKSIDLKRENDTLVIDLVELNDRPGRLEFGAGYDTRDGGYLTALYERYNLLPGVFGGVELRLGKDLQAARSYIFAKEAFGAYDFGIDTTGRRVKGSDYGYTHNRVEIEPYLARNLTPNLRGELGLGYRWDQMSAVDAAAQSVFGAEVGKRNGAFLRMELNYTAPKSEADRFTWGGSVAYKLYGLGESERISEIGLTGEAKLALSETYSLGLRVAAGKVEAHGQAKLRTPDRFTSGGAEFRGFANRGMGPSVNGWRVGGDTYSVFSVDLQRDVGEIWGSKTQIGLFADVGSVWGGPTGSNNADRVWRSTAGLSLTMDLGGVPLQAYVAKPLKSVKGDKEQVFGLGVQFLR